MTDHKTILYFWMKWINKLFHRLDYIQAVFLHIVNSISLHYTFALLANISLITHKLFKKNLNLRIILNHLRNSKSNKISLKSRKNYAKIFTLLLIYQYLFVSVICLYQFIVWFVVVSQLCCKFVTSKKFFEFLQVFPLPIFCFHRKFQTNCNL